MRVCNSNLCKPYAWIFVHNYFRNVNGSADFDEFGIAGFMRLWKFARRSLHCLQNLENEYPHQTIKNLQLLSKETDFVRSIFDGIYRKRFVFEFLIYFLIFIFSALWN